MGVKIYGASDDLIEVEGDIRDEFGYNYDEADNPGRYLAFSDGTVIKIKYGDRHQAVWRLTVLEQGVESVVKHTPVISEDEDPDPYSDIVEIESPDIRWVVVGDIYIKRDSTPCKVFLSEDSVIRIDDSLYDGGDYNEGEGKLLALSDGTVIHPICEYYDGDNWALALLRKGKGSTVELIPPSDEPGDCFGSIEVLDPGISWIVIGDMFRKGKRNA